MDKKKKLRTKKAVARRNVVRVGDLVEVMFGGENVKGQIVENRGRIGVKGRNLYRIVLNMDTAEPMSIELPLDRIKVTRRAST